MSDKGQPSHLTEKESRPKIILKSSLCERLKTWIRELLIVSMDNPNTKVFLKSYSAVIKEKKRHAESKKNVPIHQFSIFRKWWEAVLTIAYVMYYITMPVRLAFIVRNPVNLRVKPIDILILSVDVIFLTEIILIFHTGYTVELTHAIILDKKKVMKHYLLGFFAIDFVSSFPFDFILMQIFPRNLYLFVCAQCMSLFKLFRFYTFLKYFTNSTKIFFKGSFSIRFLGRILEFIFLLNTGICLINIIGTSLFNERNVDATLWFVRLNTTKSIAERYKYGLVFSLAIMATSGFGSMPPVHIGEMSVTLIVMLGLGMYKYYICAFIFEEIKGAASVTNEYLEMISQIEEYMRHKQLPVQTQEKFMDYFNYRFQNKYFREEYLLSALSEHLRSEVMLHSCQNLIKSESFQNTPEQLMGSIISRLHYEVYLPGDVITKTGAVGDCMYFISRGTVGVYTPTGKEMFHLDDGDFFGEVSMIMKDNKRLGTVVALEMTEIFRFDKKDFRELIGNTEDLLKKIETLATIRINKTILAEKVHSESRGFAED